MGEIKLKAATLVETMVASVIFLILFSIALTTVSRLTIPRENDVALIEADHQMMTCFEQYRTRENGIYTRNFEWGAIEIKLAPYRDYSDLREMKIAAEIRGERKRLEVRYVVEN